MKLTNEQLEIAEASRAIREGEALKVIAFAGAGKTTTLKAIAGVRDDRGIYLAFNKAIAEEASAKLAGTRCTGSTMHALAYGVQAREIGSPLNLQTRTVINEIEIAHMRFPRIKGWGAYRVAGLIRRTMNTWCASADPHVMRHHAVQALIETVGDPNTMRDGMRRKASSAVIQAYADPATRAAAQLFETLIEQNRWSHDMYLKRLDIEPQLARDALRRFQYILLDEAQDINPVQRSIAVKSGRPLVAVGDPYQQIYSWRGAENALGLLPGKELYLTQSFRFGEDIAQVARDILAARPDGGPVQRLVGSGGRFIPADWRGAPVAIVCRTNIGMFDAALGSSLANRSIHIDNMESIQADLIAARALFEGHPIRNGSPIAQFSSWDELCAEAEAGAGEITRIVQIVREGRDREIGDLAERNAPSEQEADVAIVTGHRSKGREWPGVWLGPDWKDVEDLHYAFQKAETISPKEAVLAMEGFNVLYVAATRAIGSLRGEKRLVYPDLAEKERQRTIKQAKNLSADKKTPGNGNKRNGRKSSPQQPAAKPRLANRPAGMRHAIASGTRIGSDYEERHVDRPDFDGPFQ